MTPERRTGVMLAGALAVVLAGGFALWGAREQVRDARFRMDKRLRQLRELQAVEREVRQAEAAVAQLERARAAGELPDAPALAALAPASLKPGLRETGRAEQGGWQMVTYEAMLRDASLADAMDWAANVDAAPNWRLVECRIAGTRETGAFGDVTLRFTALLKE